MSKIKILNRENSYLNNIREKIILLLEKNRKAPLRANKKYKIRFIIYFHPFI